MYGLQDLEMFLRAQNIIEVILYIKILIQLRWAYQLFCYTILRVQQNVVPLQAPSRQVKKSYLITAPPTIHHERSLSVLVLSFQFLSGFSFVCFCFSPTRHILGTTHNSYNYQSPTSTCYKAYPWSLMNYHFTHLKHLDVSSLSEHARPMRTKYTQYP